VKGIILAATSKNGKNQTFNLGTGKEVKIKKLAKLILVISHSRSKIIFKPMRKFDHIKNRRLDITKAKKLLSYNPSTNIKNGLEKTYEWFLPNR